MGDPTGLVSGLAVELIKKILHHINIARRCEKELASLASSLSILQVINSDLQTYSVAVNSGRFAAPLSIKKWFKKLDMLLQQANDMVEDCTNPTRNPIARYTMGKNIIGMTALIDKHLNYAPLIHLVQSLSQVQQPTGEGQEDFLYVDSVVPDENLVEVKPTRRISDRIFGKLKKNYTLFSALAELRETLEMLEENETILRDKITAELGKAKMFTQENNKSEAAKCVKRKKLYMEQAEYNVQLQIRILDQISILENAKATKDTVQALRAGAAAMKLVQKATSISDVEKIMDEIDELTESMRQIQEAISTPIAEVEYLNEAQVL